MKSHSVPARPDFSALASLHSAFVRNVVARILGPRCPDDIEDVTQTAWLNAWRGWERFEGRCAVKSWLYRVAQNAAFYHLRHRRQDASLEALVEYSNNTGFPLPRSLSFHDRRAELLPDIIAAKGVLGKLGRKERDAVTLHYLDELDYTTVAALCGAPTSTVKARVRRGLRKMRWEMEGRREHA